MKGVGATADGVLLWEWDNNGILQAGGDNSLTQGLSEDPSQLSCIVLLHLSGDAVRAHSFPWVHQRFTKGSLRVHSE